jgi:hypothetical protein
VRVARWYGRIRARVELRHVLVAQRAAAALGNQQLLWSLGETVLDAGAMNVFAGFERPDGVAGPTCHVPPHTF